MAYFDVSIINSMSDDLDHAELGAATLIIARLLSGATVSLDNIHKIVGVSRKEWLTLSEQVLAKFKVSEAGELSMSAASHADEESPKASTSTPTEAPKATTPAPSRPAPLPRAGATLDLPFETKTQRPAPVCPKRAPHVPAPRKTLKATAIDSAVDRLVTEGMTPAKARAAIMGIFQKYRDESVVAAIQAAERCDPVALIGYLHGVLKGGNKSFNGPGISAPSKPRPAATAENLGISKGLSDLISERNKGLRMNLED